MSYVPLPITLFDLFSSHLDFLGVPTRYFFELLSYFCKDPMQAERLLYLSSKEGYEELYVRVHLNSVTKKLRTTANAQREVFLMCFRISTQRSP